MKRLAIVMMLPFAARAQLALFSFDGTTETPVGATYDYGNVAAVASKDVRFHARNIGTSAIALKIPPSVTTAEFSISAINGSPPYMIDPSPAAHPFLEFTVRFSGSTPASYSATLQVNTMPSVTLHATVVPAPAIGVSSTCALNGSQIDSGAVQIGKTGVCNVSVLNPYAQPLTISTIALTGSGFQLTGAPTLPATLAPAQAIPLTIQLTPVCGTTNYSGTLTINTQPYALTGTGFLPPLPAPSLTFDSNVFASGQQPEVTMSLPASYPCTASGYLNLTFTPGTTIVTDDPAVMFMAGSIRSLPFSVTPNTTQISFSGQSSAVFQTGTTAGTITFTATGNGLQIAGNPSTTINIPPAAIAIESATASNQTLGQLNVEVIGFDNTYTAGAMSFTFFDTSGKPIGSGAISADFTSQFKTYFNSQSGSSFLMRVSFPTTGAQAQVGSVQATLTNAAGEAQTGSLTFK